MICLNWLALDGGHCGAKRRAIELHARLPHRQFNVFVNPQFPAADRDRIPGARFRDVTAPRSMVDRVRTTTRAFWEPRLADTACSLWATETLPVLDQGPTVLTVHDLRYMVSPRYVSMRRFLLHRHRMRPALRRADRIIAVSYWTADELVRHFNVSQEKIRVVPNGVDVALAREPAGDSSAIADPFILSVGHMEPRKNLHTLLSAFAELRKTWRGKLVIVGRDAGEGEMLRTLTVRLGLDHDVVFAGAVPDRDLARLYRDCHLLVCPAVYEGFGITLLEGFAHGKPVVASDIPPHREVAGDAALWFDAFRNDPGELADRMADALGQGGNTLADASRSRVSKFTWERAAEALDGVYTELVGG